MNGKMRNMLLSTVPIKIGGKYFIHAMSVDITEQKRYEEELMNYRDHLEDLVKERTQELEEAQNELIRKERLSTLGRLTATVAHELRNPLGTVRKSVFFIGDSINHNQTERVD